MKKFAVVAIMTAAALVLTASPAFALPSAQPDTTFMVNGKVHALEKVGGRIWIGGSFSQVLNASGQNAQSVSNLAVLDASTGQLIPGLTPPGVTGTGAIVYDMSLGADGNTLYIAGKFSSVGGASRQNAAAINGTTGLVLPFNPKPGAGKSILATSSRVYVGTNKIFAYTLAGKKDTGFAGVTATIDVNLRTHLNAAAWWDLQIMNGDLLGACVCDWVNGNPAKAVAKINPNSGQVDSSWRPKNLDADSAAFGFKILPDGGNFYLAAGGNDYAASYRESDGHLNWITDTSGSAQAVAEMGDKVIFGGHFEWVQRPGDPGCGSNQNPSNGCWKQPRIVALEASNGHPDTSWTPTLGPQYPGVWDLLVDGNKLNVGGQFTSVGGHLHKFYVRFS